MIKCPDCDYFGGKCTKASEEITECEEYKKKPYMALVNVDGLNYKFERIENNERNKI